MFIGAAIFALSSSAIVVRAAPHPYKSSDNGNSGYYYDEQFGSSNDGYSYEISQSSYSPNSRDYAPQSTHNKPHDTGNTEYEYNVNPYSDSGFQSTKYDNYGAEEYSYRNSKHHGHDGPSNSGEHGGSSSGTGWNERSPASTTTTAWWSPPTPQSNSGAGYSQPQTGASAQPYTPPWVQPPVSQADPPAQQAPPSTVETPSFAATCSGVGCNAYVPTQNNGFQQYTCSRVAGGKCSWSTSSVIGQGATLIPTAPMTAIDTTDYLDGTKYLIYADPNQNYRLLYYTTSGFTQSTWSTTAQSIWFSDNAFTANAKSLKSATWLSSGKYMFGVWWVDNSGTLNQIVNVAGTWKFVGAIPDIEIGTSADFTITSSITGGGTTTTFDVISTSGSHWQQTVSSGQYPTSNAWTQSAGFTLSPNSLRSISATVAGNVFQLYTIGSGVDNLAEYQFTAGTYSYQWTPLSNPQKLYTKVSGLEGSITTIAMTAGLDTSAYTAFFWISQGQSSGSFAIQYGTASDNGNTLSQAVQVASWCPGCWDD